MMMTYKETFEHWKILFDYCCWVRDGGEAIYGTAEIATAWCEALMVAMVGLV